ncbi:MAG: hypothetical protein KDK28_17265 [Maritimibacter sp.]|nr:hypothetical protein [Maritimibacter sp.]
MARRSSHIASRLALGLTGAGLAVAGLVLLLRAAWLGLAAALGALWATLILGGALVLLGALLLALGTRPARSEPRPDTALILQALTAFFDGLAAGRSSRDR